MKFMPTFAVKPEIKSRDQAIAQFKQTGGATPKGTRLLGRWTVVDFSCSFALHRERRCRGPHQELATMERPHGAAVRAGARGCLTR